MSSGSVNGGRKNTGFKWDRKKLDHRTEWELEKRDQAHERMVKEFFESRAKKKTWNKSKKKK